MCSYVPSDPVMTVAPSIASTAVLRSAVACGEMTSTSPFSSACAAASGSGMKRTVISSMFAVLSPLYSGFAVSVTYWSATKSLIMYGPLAVTSSGSSGISVKLKPLFQKLEIGASAASSSFWMASMTACLASALSSMPRAFLPTM